MSDWPDEGDKAPVFTLSTDEGEKWKLSDWKGKWVVVYFYPKDDTPGCTREACGFRDQKVALKKAGVQLVGLSPDDQASHAKFRNKYKLNFPLLVDKGTQGGRKIWCLARKKYVWEKIDGNRQEYLPN